MTIFLIIGLIISVLFIYLGNRKTAKTVVTIKSKATQKLRIPNSYFAEKKRGKSGVVYTDWAYYDHNGNLVNDIILMNLLFDSFQNEDWHSDHDYYVNDENYVHTTTDTGNQSSSWGTNTSIDNDTIVEPRHYESQSVDSIPESHSSDNGHSSTHDYTPSESHSSHSHSSNDHSSHDYGSSSSHDYSSSSSSSDYSSSSSDSGSSSSDY